MRKVTPQKYEQFYSIYPNKIKVNDIIKDRKNLEQQIINMGKIPV
jgi:radical SAM domain protein